MRNLIIGFIIGFILGSTTIVVLADIGVLYGSNNIEKGTTANPLYIEVVP